MPFFLLDLNLTQNQENPIVVIVQLLVTARQPSYIHSVHKHPLTSIIQLNPIQSNFPPQSHPNMAGSTAMEIDDTETSTNDITTPTTATNPDAAASSSAAAKGKGKDAGKKRFEVKKVMNFVLRFYCSLSIQSN